MSEVILIEAVPDDAASIAELIRLAFEEYRGRLLPPSGAHDETADTVGRELGAGCRAAIALREGAAVGCVLYEPAHECVRLSRLSVRPDCRGEGIGRALMGYVEDQTRALGLRCVRLGVRLALPEVREWYERLGYHQVRLEAHAGHAEPTYAVLEKRLEP
jgi:ribosomal protein S18 acetylase RimI-like enzyme